MYSYRKQYEYKCVNCGKKRTTFKADNLENRTCYPCKKIMPLEGQTSIFDILNKPVDSVNNIK